MDKLKLHTPNLTDDNRAKIAALFPHCVLEGKIDFDLLKQELSNSIIEGTQERYQLNWVGKREALLNANAPIAKTLRPCREESVNFDTTENLYIEGDNLDALKLLQETYLNKVKMIYIDPPYNTGNDFIYEDDFAENTADYLQRSNQKDEAGNRLTANPESNGRFHSDWLSMMYPRLKLARNLLRDDGVIFISIDDNEQANLKRLCDEVFGGDNFVADFIWSGGRKNDSKLVSVSHEYIVCCVKSLEWYKQNKILWRQRKKGLDEIYSQHEKLKRQLPENYEEITNALKEWFKCLPDSNPAKIHKHYCNVDAKGIYFPDNISWPGGGGPKYEVLHPITNKPVKVPSRGWITNQEKMRQWITDDLVHFGNDENSVPCSKAYLKDREYQVPYSVFYQDGRASTKRLRTLMDGDLFDHPKDETVLEEYIQFSTQENDIILDFFSGSATTAHAVMQLNAEDGGKRKFIMVQIPEACDEKSEAFKAGYKTIADIGKERIRRAGQKIHQHGRDAIYRVSDANNFGADAVPDAINRVSTDIGFRVLKIDSSNMNDVYYSPDAISKEDLHQFIENIKPDRSDEDLLFQVLLDWGVDLSLPIESKTIADKPVFVVADDAIVACFDRNGGVTEAFITELATLKPLRAVFCDAGFASDSVKINIEQIFKLLSPSTDIKTI